MKYAVKPSQYEKLPPELRDMEDPWAKDAALHYQRFRPKEFAELLKSGKAAEWFQYLADKVFEELKLVHRNLPDNLPLLERMQRLDDALVLAKHRYLFPPSEEEDPENFTQE
jgi:hypothetical protein